MPYIPNERRKALFSDSKTDYNSDISSSGELNFMLTDMILSYLRDKGKCYKTINDIIGALEGAKLEFYRRVVVPYEDKKKKQNPPDVYRGI